MSATTALRLARNHYEAACEMLLTRTAADIGAELQRQDKHAEMELRDDGPVMSRVLGSSAVQTGLLDTRVVAALTDVVQRPSCLHAYMNDGVAGSPLRAVLSELRAAYAAGPDR